MLRAHYRAPIEVTRATIGDATAALDRLDALARRFGLATLELSAPLSATESLDPDWEPVARFLAAMDEDLDTPTAVASLFELVSLAHAAEDRGEQWRAHKAAAQVVELAGALGLALLGEHAELDELATSLAAERDAARARGDFAAADDLRGRLVELGYVVEDTPAGTRFSRTT
jgi:cysteinyl-tRNA synthetase